MIRYKVTKNLQGVFFFVLVYPVVNLLIRLNVFTEYIYPYFYRYFYLYYTKVFGWLFFSVGDFMYLFLILFFLKYIFVFIRSFFYRPVAWRVLNKFFGLIGLFYFLFHFLWGFNYYKRPILSIDAKETDIVQLKKIAENLLDDTRRLSFEVPRNKHNEFIFNENSFDNSLQDSLFLQKKGMYLPYRIFPKVREKNSLYSFIMNYAGVSGYYNPFTAEAQVVNNIPEISQPFTMAHEQAHQMGYGFESEANFIGYLTCIQSNDVSLKYSAKYKALKYVLGAIYSQDSVFVNHQLKSFSVPMKADRLTEQKYFAKYNSFIDNVFGYLNDQYLKSNNQVEGLQSYNKFVLLLLKYERLKNRS